MEQLWSARDCCTEGDTDFAGRQFGRIDQTIAMGALFTAYHLGCKAILALTESGSTALWMSRHRIQVPIYAMTTQPLSQHKIYVEPMNMR